MKSPKICCGTAPTIFPVNKEWVVSCNTCGKTSTGKNTHKAIEGFNRKVKEL